jgi:hypothetical protein
MRMPTSHDTPPAPIHKMPHYQGDHPAIHDMLIFGEPPMFHLPHDYQVLLEISLSAAGRIRSN